MGPAILFCSSSSAVHLWGQITPLNKDRHREGSISLPHGFPICSANADFTGDSRRGQVFFFNPAFSSERYRRPTYPVAWRRALAAAPGSEISVEEGPVATSEAPAEEGLSSEPSPSNDEAPAATERKTPARRTLNRSNSNANKAVVVSPAELVPGATFPGKVIAIQTFGAFVDLGAFSNGLIHISRLSRSYVKKVEDVVQVGQDVKVQVLEFDSQTNRLSLMLVEEGRAEAPQEGEAGDRQPQRSSQQQSRPPRKDSAKRPPNSQRQAATTTMKKNEIVTGTVKNIIRSGVFLTLPDGTDGYLPIAEVIFKGPNTNTESQFQVGQEVTVRVLRIDKGRVNLTMRREVNYEKLNEDLNRDVVDGATNPFEIAFRRNELIASFLADRDKQKVQAEANEETTEKDEAVSPVEEVKGAALVENLAMEEEEGMARGVDAVKGEMVSSEVADSAEEAKGLKLAVGQEDDAADDVEQKAAVTDEEIKVDEALSSVEEAKDQTPVAEKLAVEEEKDVGGGVNGGGGSSEAVIPVEEMKDVAEESVAEKEKDVAVGIDAREDVSIPPEAVSAVGEVKNATPVVEPAMEEGKNVAIGIDAREDVGISPEEPVAEKEKDVAVGIDAREDVGISPEEPVAEKEKDVAVGIDAREDVGISPEAVSAVGEVKNATSVVEKPAMEEGKNVAVGVDARKGEGVLLDAETSVGVNNLAEEEKPAEEKEEEAVSGANGMKEAEKLVVEEKEVAVRSVQ